MHHLQVELCQSCRAGTWRGDVRMEDAVVALTIAVFGCGWTGRDLPVHVGQDRHTDEIVLPPRISGAKSDTTLQGAWPI
jgi:hypothetical protein